MWVCRGSRGRGGGGGAYGRFHERQNIFILLPKPWIMQMEFQQFDKFKFNIFSNHGGYVYRLFSIETCKFKMFSNHGGYLYRFLGL